MAVYTVITDTKVEAFKWLGDPLLDYDLPGWAKGLALHAPTDGTLHVPCWNGTFLAKPGDWIVRDPIGAVSVVPSDMFAATYALDTEADKPRNGRSSSAKKD